MIASQTDDCSASRRKWEASIVAVFAHRLPRFPQYLGSANFRRLLECHFAGAIASGSMGEMRSVQATGQPTDPRAEGQSGVVRGRPSFSWPALLIADGGIGTNVCSLYWMNVLRPAHT